MSRIIQVEELYTYYINYRLWAYVGIDYDTGEYKYFKIQDNNKLKEFKIDDSNNDQLLRNEIKECPFFSIAFTDVIPQELKKKVSEYIEKHTTFNLGNDLPTNFINFNRCNLLIKYKHSYSCSYDYFLNTIYLNVYEKQWKKLSTVRQTRAHYSLIHELGHMKARRYSIDEKNNKLYFGTGFRKIEINLSPTHLDNGDVFYAPLNLGRKNCSLNERTLEEIMNDYECSLVFPGYVGTYPNYGEILNDICDNKLLKARYTNGTHEYYNSLCQIIDDEKMATELLEMMTESIYADNIFCSNSSQSNAMKLLKRYQERKNGN